MKTLVLIPLLALGCSGTARGLEAYRTDTQKLLETKQDTVKTCYDAALAKDAKAAGTVVIKFDVAPKTGAITNAMVDPAKTTAPGPVGECVLQAVQGLKLDPPDKNPGRASFAYEFKPS
jgi:hypothetical protein